MLRKIFDFGVDQKVKSFKVKLYKDIILMRQMWNVSLVVVQP